MPRNSKQPEAMAFAKRFLTKHHRLPTHSEIAAEVEVHPKTTYSKKWARLNRYLRTAAKRQASAVSNERHSRWGRASRFV